MFAIPIIDANDSLSEVLLDGRTFFLQLSWNSEAALWTLAIENAYNELIVAGLALVPDTPLLSRYRHLAVPAGELVIVAVDGRRAIDRAALPAGDAALIYIPLGDNPRGAL